MSGAQRTPRSARLAELPEILTVDEAAAFLRIGRASAYEMARRWRETGGAEGLPVIMLGRTLRVPRAALERMLDIDNTVEVPTVGRVVPLQGSSRRHTGW